MQKSQTTLNVNLGDVLVKKGTDLMKKIRFGIGCGVSECEIQELLYLSKLLCLQEEVCYITKDMEIAIKERINGK